MKVEQVAWTVYGRCSICDAPRSATVLRAPGEELLPLRPEDQENPCTHCEATFLAAREKALGEPTL